jgi:protein-S-isoprenylcysteine O-methyltransferase Ste14
MLRSLELRVPPDLVALIVVGLMWLVGRLGGALSIPILPKYLVGAALMLLGAVIIVAARDALSRQRTAWQPGDPSAATSLVTGGVYAYSRNPMYVGTWVFLLGTGVLIGSAYSLLLSVAYVLWVDRFQIAPEERALAVRFAHQYESYRRSVRRWV